MTPLEFLTSVWPPHGPYCIATPNPHGGFKHKTYPTIEAAAQVCDNLKDTTDVYFACHSLIENRIWDAHSKNHDGTTGKWRVRTHKNMQEAQSFYLDIDVKAEEDAYPDQASAVIALRAFIDATGLPIPTIVSSGSGGLHCYWLLTDPILSTEWRTHGERLKALTIAHGLKADPSRTADQASVLRVVGTYNHKKGGKNPVKLLKLQPTVHTDRFLKLLNDAAVKQAIPEKKAFTAPAHALLGSNLDVELEPVSIKSLIKNCAQVQRQLSRKGVRQSQPEWYYMLNLLRFTEGGDKLAHKYSALDPQYDEDETNKKLNQLKSFRDANGQRLGPTSCAKMIEINGAENCKGCPFRVKSPIVAARQRDPAPPPVLQLQVAPSLIVTQPIPDCPKPFIRLKSGAIGMEVTGNDGEEYTRIVLHHDLYPTRLMVNGPNQKRQVMWQANLPKQGPTDFVLDVDVPYDQRKLSTELPHAGVTFDKDNLKDVGNYMIAYLRQLQQEADAETQANHLGWTEDFSGFIMPDRILLADGTAKPASLGEVALSASSSVCKAGTLERQVELLKFWDNPAYLSHQFLIMCSLASPIFHATGQNGVIVNAIGRPGASKSTSLYTACGFWGKPDDYAINGTAHGATEKARMERMSTLANLPIGVDEITDMDVREAKSLAFGVTQPGKRIRLDRKGKEQVSKGGLKATIMITTANRSLHGLLSSDNTTAAAGSMRVFEMTFKRQSVHTKPEADTYLRDIKANYGHIGEAFAAFVVRHREKIDKRVQKVMAEIDVEMNIAPAERFWSAAAATVLVALDIARKLGLIGWSAEMMKTWIYTVQIPLMRGVVSQSYSNPLGILADYLETVGADLLVTNGKGDGNVGNVVQNPRGAMVGHWLKDQGIILINKTAFRTYCTKVGASAIEIYNELSQPSIGPNGKPEKVIPDTNAKRTLGAGTDYAKAQTYCFIVNMNHSEVSGRVDIKVVQNTTPQIKPAPGKPNLKVVK